MGGLGDHTRRLGKNGRPLQSTTRSTERGMLSLLSYACALEGGGGAYMMRGHGAHGKGAPMQAAAIGEDTYYPAPQRLN